MEKALSLAGTAGPAQPPVQQQVRRPAPKGVRFAPSPTGRFHVGNLRTAWVSHEFARAWSEPWIVRFEDIDAPRAVPGAREDQLADMAALGLIPDQIVIQSQLRTRHWETFTQAIRDKRVYPCSCSRKEVREALERSGSAPHAVPGSAAPTYSGHCRDSKYPGSLSHGLPTLAWRFAVEDDPSGRQDFIVARSGIELDAQGWPREPESFAPAYHWACAVDDADGDYRLLVRAADLAAILPQHRAIMAWLAESQKQAPRWPAVFHTRLVTQNDGHRLEKRTQGATLSELGQAGYGMEQILDCFKRSWDVHCLRPLPPGSVDGENTETMTLGDLGLRAGTPA